MKKSLFGLSENMAAAFAYVGVFATGIITLVMADKEDKTLRFHALQSIVLFGALFGLLWLLGWIPFIGGIIGWVLKTSIFVSWIFLTLISYLGARFKVPIIGDACWAYVNKE
jgi:uncharacterized membrane protein